MSPALRVVTGACIAVAIALVARRARSLSTGGAVAAAAVGTVAVAAGWGWGAMLIAFFISSTALSRWRGAVKEARTGAVVEKGGERDSAQVLANGGVFALGAVLSVLGWSGAPALALGALSAAASDTWATEVGTLAAAPPRSIVGWRRVPVGTSGGVSAPGLAAALAGAATLALLARGLAWPGATAWGALAGGLAGSTADSLLGALVQARRWCDRCNAATERHVHSCGERTRHSGGLDWLDNDAVNLLATVVGGSVAVIVWLAVRH